jgi:hypothetical protein
MAFGMDTISDWTQSTLVKFIRDLFQNQPPDFLPLLKAEEVLATTKITVGDKIEFSREPRFRKVGAAGSPAFANSWVNYGSGWADAAYWRDPFGMVHLRGVIKSGTVGSGAFTLPPGFRPATNEIFAVMSNGAVGRVDVTTDGQVAPITPSNNTYVSLSGITFRTT